MIVVVMPANSGDQRLRRWIFMKLWQLQFLQVVLLSNNAVYAYSPYPRVNVFEVTDHNRDLFPPIPNDLQGYTVSVPVENDIPRIFYVRDVKGQMQIKGFAFQIFWNFVRRMNMSLHISKSEMIPPITSSVNMSNIIHRIAIKHLEISMHPYTGINEVDGIMSYPIFKVENCLIIPVRNEIPRYMYLLRPYKLGSWTIILLAIGCSTIVLVWISPCLLQTANFYDKLSRTFLEAIALLLFLPSTCQCYQPKVRYLIIYLLLASTGFLITSFYSNLLSSFYTTILVGEQIDTFEALIAAKMPILSKYYEANFPLSFVPKHLQTKVQHLIVGVNASVQISHLLSFNTSFSYPLTAERWTFLALQQQYANKPIYRYSEICFGSPGIGYPMRTDSHLEHHMTRFILDVQMAGLQNYWLISDFKDALRAGYVHLIDNVLPFKALDIYSLYVAWCLLVAGLSTSVCAFVAEIYISRFAELQRQNND